MDPDPFFSRRIRILFFKADPDQNEMDSKHFVQCTVLFMPCSCILLILLFHWKVVFLLIMIIVIIRNHTVVGDYTNTMKAILDFNLDINQAVKQHGYIVHINIEVKRSCQLRKIYHCNILYFLHKNHTSLWYSMIL